MNLLCDYENYLRDRYILGQPVRYMYGGFGDASSEASASQSKQKVYGPDGNEYTYIDDPTSPNAGRYYRNVGGPGGGRIVFLDEVQETNQKRQMEDANKAAQPQVADDRQSAETATESKDEGKSSVFLEDFNNLAKSATTLAYSDLTSLEEGRKKLDDLLASFRELASRPISRDKAYRLEALRDLLNNSSVKEAQNLYESVFFDDTKKFVANKLANLQAQKRYHAPGGKKDTRNYWKESPEEIIEWIRNANDARVYDTALDIAANRVESAKTKKDIQDALRITNALYEANVRGYRGNNSFYRKWRDITDKALTLSRKLSEENNLPEAAEAAAPQSPEPSPTVQESKPSAAKKRAKEEREAKRRAKEEQKASSSVPKKKRAKKVSNVPTAQEVAESETTTLERAPFDVSGLGLPGSQDSVLDAKEGGNRDAAYFIRRDLGEESPSDQKAQDPPVATLEPTPQEQPAKPRPERWTPLKSAMNDDDRRVVESTRQRLNFGLGDFAWRLAIAKEKKDWAKVKELTVLAAKRYLEQARRAYRSHGGAEALAAFDESLSGDGLTVGQVRDRIVDKFRKMASMKIEDLHKYAGDRLDAYDKFNKTSDASTNTRALALNNLLDAQHRAPNAVPYTPPEKGKVYEVPVDSLNLDPSRFQFKLNTNSRGVTDDLEGAEFDPMQAGIIHVWRDPDDGKDYVVNGHHRFNLAKNSGYDGKVIVRYIDADTADDAKAFGAVANIADSKGTATDVAEFIRTRGSDDIRTPGGKKIATKNKLLADGRVLSKLDETIFRKLKNGSIDEKTARVIAAELPDDKDKQLRLFADIERLGLDASQAQDRAWAYASIQGEKQQGSLFGDDAPMEYDIESRSKLIGEIKKALTGAKNAAKAGGSSKNNEYWNKQGLTSSFDRDRASQLSKTAGKTLQFFKDKIRLTGPMQNVIKEETDAYRKALKEGKDASQIVERAIERIKDVSQGGDGSLRRMEGLGLEYEDRLPSVESEQAGQSVGKKKEGGEKRDSSGAFSETVRDERTTGEVLEAGGADRLLDGGNGSDSASVIAEDVFSGSNPVPVKPASQPKPRTKTEKKKVGDSKGKDELASTKKQDSSPSFQLSDSAQQELIQGALREITDAAKKRFENVEDGEKFQNLLDIMGAGAFKPSEVLAMMKQGTPSEPPSQDANQKRIAEEAKKTDIPEIRVREELDAPRQSKTSTPQGEEKPDWLVANADLTPEVVQQKINEMSTTRSAEPKPKAKAEKRENDETPLGERSAQRIIAEEVSKSTAPRTRFPKVIDEKIAPLPPEPEDGSEEPEFLKELRKLAALEQERKNYRPPKFNPDADVYSYTPETASSSFGGSVTPRYHRDKEVADTIRKWQDEQKKAGKNADIVPYDELFPDGEPKRKPGRPKKQGVVSGGDVSKQIEDFDRERASKGQKKSDVRAKLDEVAPKKNNSKDKKSSAKTKPMERGQLDRLAKQAVGLRDSRRDVLAPETISKMMEIFDQVSKHGTIQDVKDFMRAVDVVPISKSKKGLRREFQLFNEDYALNRYKATAIRKM